MRKYRMTKKHIQLLTTIIREGRLWDMTRAELKEMQVIEKTYSKNCITDTVNAIKIMG